MKKYLYLAGLLLLSGCGTTSTREPVPMPVLREPEYSSVEPSYNPGSLYDASNTHFLFSDNRAMYVGDIVLVQVNEETKAEHTLDTSSNRENSSNFDVNAFKLPGTNLGKSLLTTKLGYETSSDFAADGATSQETSFTATVAARVVRLLPGGIMEVEGARRIRINNETQILVVKGLVRQRDLGSDNTVPSSSLAEAQVEVYGNGILSAKHKAGWLSRVLSTISPF